MFLQAGTGRLFHAEPVAGPNFCRTDQNVLAGCTLFLLPKSGK